MEKAWVARDRSGGINLYLDKPVKAEYYPFWDTDRTFIEILESDLPSDINPQWADEEPIEVNVNITKASDDVVTISKDRYEQLLQYEQEYVQRQSVINSFMQNK